ncbi:MAG: PBSX family phage terminase large subunit [Patescibacteria group bacterium]|nr:PBSX family phage terminase large subunit [Patescibacteria group bacterium]
MTQPILPVNVQFVSTFKEVFNEDYRTIIFHGGRGSGKSYHVALGLLLRGRKRRLRILCTREIQNTIKDSVHKLLKDIITRYGFADYTLTENSVINSITGTEFIFKGLKHNINEIKSTEGIDIAWVEEAQSISEDSLKILVPTIRKPGSQLIYTFNRVNELDPVYVRYCITVPPKTYVKKVNYDTLDKVGLFPEELRLEMEQDRQNPETYAHIWLGEPIGQAEMSIISRTETLEAMQRAIPDDGMEEIGVDVARMGNDRTVFWLRRGLKTIRYRVHEKLRTTQVCDALERFAHHKKDVPLKIDDTGVGGGVTDEMLKRGYNVVAVNFGGEAMDKDKYPNWISEAWFHMSQIMPEAELPYNSDLLMELTTRQWGQDNKGKRRVESKGDYKKRGFRSPDIADACIICYAPVHVDGFLQWAKMRADASAKPDTTFKPQLR